MALLDKIAQEANRSRSQRGSDFEKKLSSMFTKLKRRGKIKSFVPQPPVYGTEFNPDFLIEKNNGEFVSVDATTTARSDRLRAKQWDAYGTKLYFKEHEGNAVKLTAVVVIQEHNISAREKTHFKNAKKRVKLPHSALDAVVSVRDLMKLIQD